MRIWLKDIAGNFYKFNCYIPMKPFTFNEIADFIENAQTLTELAEISEVLRSTTEHYNAQTLEAFHLLLQAKKDIILNNDTLPQNGTL